MADLTTGNLEAADRAPVPRLLSEMFLLERTYRSHGVSHPLTLQVAEQLNDALGAISMPFSLQFVGPAAFLNRELVPLDLRSFQQASDLNKALTNLGFNEITFKFMPGNEDLIKLGEALARGAAGPNEFLQTTRIPGIEWRELLGAQWGLEMEVVDPEIYTATQVSLAVADAEVLISKSDDPWEWGLGLAVVRRLGRAIETSPGGLLRALEISPDGWSIARRAIATTLRVMLVLDQLKTVLALRRAIAHATLALACEGLRDREGEPLTRAAEALMGRLLKARSYSRTGIEPHRIRVDAMVRQLLPENSEDRRVRSVLHLILLAYDLERRRCPLDRDFDLTSGDLLAFGVQESKRRYDAGYVRLMLLGMGVLPTGTIVRLADGRVGVVIMPNTEHPLLPKVLVDKKIITPTAPVTMASGAGILG